MESVFPRTCVRRLPACLRGSFLSFRSTPLRSIRPAAALNAANITNGGVGTAADRAVRRDPNSRVSCAGGRVSAPVRFARLIARVRPCARAKRRAHFARWPNRGLFSRRRETENEAAPRMPLPSLPPYIEVYTINVKLFLNYFKNDEQFMFRMLPLVGLSGDQFLAGPGVADDAGQQQHRQHARQHDGERRERALLQKLLRGELIDICRQRLVVEGP